VRLPLVIQIGYYRPDLFLPDGSAPTAYATQALAAQGFAVLDLNMEVPGSNSMGEGEAIVAQIDVAVETLARSGIIDAQRVGLIGHSHAGYDVFYAVTHPGRTRIAASIVHDSGTGSFPEYLESQATGQNSWASIARTNASALPAGRGVEIGFWLSRSSWLRNDPIFNLDRLATPTLLLHNGVSGQDSRDVRSNTLPLVAAFRFNRRPMDYLFQPREGHILLWPRGRKNALDVAVDWMNFWLQNRETSDPSRVAQYDRWRMIRERWQAQQAWEAGGHPVGSIPATGFVAPASHSAPAPAQ